MKTKLTGINEEPTYAAFPDGTTIPQAQSPSGTITMARLSVSGLPSPQGYNVIVIPYAVIEGAQIGDEFTLHLERVKK